MSGNLNSAHADFEEVVEKGKPAMSFDVTILSGQFKWPDYLLFLVLLAISCSGGLWYSALATRSKKIADIRDYLLGGRNMSTIPVSLSLIASYVSGVTVLGTPAEIFNYGSQYLMVVVAIFASGVAIIFVYLPVFSRLRLSSSYEYLQMRFNKYVRAAAAVLFLLDEILFLPMVVYVPSLAFYQLTGLNMYIVAGLMVFVCGIYTVLGGLRAVVWTDSIQSGILFIGIIVTTVVGTITAGGVKNLWNTSVATGRLDISNWSLSMYERQTGWGATIACFLYWTCFNSVNQTMVQRYLALPNRKKASIAVMLFCMGASLAIVLGIWTGLSAWTVWVNTGCSASSEPPVDDKMLPAFVTYIAHESRMTGFAGVFLAGVFGAGLSSLSVVLNACALVGVEDLARGIFNLRLKPLQEAFLARGISAILAIVALVMILVIERLGGILSVATTLSAISASTTCGVFTLGMCFWWVGPRGALMGALAGALVSGTVAAGSSAASARGYKFPPKPIPDGICPRNITFVPAVDAETIFPLFRLSYHWVAPLGFLTTLIVGALSALCLDRQLPPPHPGLITPLCWRWLPERSWQLSPYLRRRYHGQTGALLPASETEKTTEKTRSEGTGSVHSVSLLQLPSSQDSFISTRIYPMPPPRSVTPPPPHPPSHRRPPSTPPPSATPSATSPPR